ncbi:hypothetical protein EGI32_05695 [Ferruginibacter sp. HRS2-29]|nr:hypothetical protein [Ferruginibacter sp. HRS2-29]
MSEAKKTAEKRASELVNFSLKYLDGEHAKFTFSSHDGTYFCEVLERLKSLSTLSKQEWLSSRSSALRIHPIDWSETTEEEGFNFPKHDEIVDTPYQFAVSGNEHGRTHGFFISNTFYIVWLDREHNLYA